MVGMYDCGDDRIVEIKDDLPYHINYGEVNAEFYFNGMGDAYDPVSGRLIRMCLSDGESVSMEVINNKKWYEDTKLMNLINIEDNRLNPDPTLTMLTMDKSLVYGKSIFDKTKNLRIAARPDGSKFLIPSTEKIYFYIIDKSSGSNVTKTEVDIDYKGHEEVFHRDDSDNGIGIQLTITGCSIYNDVSNLDEIEWNVSSF